MDLLAFGPLGGMSPTAQTIMGGIAFLMLVLVVIAFIKAFIKICPPNEALIITGFGKMRPVIGRRAVVIPFLNRVDRMPLGLMEVPIGVRNGYSKGGIAMNIDAIANVKISSDSRVIGNAVERFLNRDVNEIRRVSKETLEGHLRGVIATLTPEQVNEDRLAFAEMLTSECEEDLMKLGLHLDTLKIQHVNDEVGYLDATGRKAIANIVRAAEIAESDARRDAEQVESQNAGRSNVRRANADAKIAQLRNELRKIQADLSSQVKSEEERTAAAAREARATAEQRLQQVRAELEGIRLQTDRVLPAEANRQAQEYKARGDAALIREKGRAVSDALLLLYEAWEKAGPNAKQIALITELEMILNTATEGVKKISIENLHVIDSGDGKTLSNYIGAYPRMLGEVFAAVNQTVGIDIPGAISGRDSAEQNGQEEKR